MQELVLATASQQSSAGTGSTSQLKIMLKSLESSPQDLLEEETDSRPMPRQSNVVLRGRARSDAQNAKRRAEANRASLEKNKNGIEDSSFSDR